MEEAGSVTMAVAHEMVRIMFFTLSRNEPYRNVVGGIVEKKLSEYE